MAQLTPNEVAGVVRTVGPPLGSTVAEWVAKSRQESSHDPDAENGVHIGLYQIDYTLHAGRGQTSKIPEIARQQLHNPLASMAVAKDLFQESGWKPWAASGGKPSPTAEDRAAADDPSPIITGKPDIIDKVGAPFADITEAVGSLVQTVWDAAGWVTDRKNWGRIVFVAIGGVILITSLGVIAKPAIEQAVPAKRTITEVRPTS